MKIKDAEYHECPTCQNRTQIAPEEHGCDHCRKPMANSGSSLRISVFKRTGDTTDHYYLCSWRCVMAVLPTLTCDYFVDLPYLHFDGEEPGRRAEDFWTALREYVRDHPEGESGGNQVSGQTR